MRLKLAAVLACAVSMMAAAASADTRLGWYVAADAGVHDMDEQTLVLRDVTLVSRTESDEGSSSSAQAFAAAAIIDEDIEEADGFALDTEAKAAVFVRAGNQVSPHWRAELEYGERPGDISDSIVSGYDGEAAGRGSLDLTSLMFNVIYDISPDSRLHPFVGLGVGAVKVETDYTGTTSDPDYSTSYSIRSSKTAAAGQVIAGLAWAASDRLNIDLTYRYLEVGKANYDVRADVAYNEYNNDCSPNCESAALASFAVAEAYGPTLVEEVYEGRMSGKIRDHSLTIGLRWSFGAPRGPAADVGPPPQETVSSGETYSSPSPVVAPVAPPARRNFTVYFPFNSATPTADGLAVISAAAQQARSQPGAPVTVTGHADTSGSAPYNIQLSQNRARMVADGLIQMGVPASAVNTDWKGEAQPAVPTGNGVKNAENRRATISIGQ
ncbi:ompA family protein [Asticcacaulis biprosthecium C19]|uniref:OmpA family protein n=1 Tax=Asticcacaulis biprosthecium C19 TaxID=715226 RepID=F4QKW5_9CAUL|nr:OmpA family protein [Asticcacaulis biprosthecium]EGF92188.1 ompA family protein [Asticcacaulis biprosthecium C19]